MPKKELTKSQKYKLAKVAFDDLLKWKNVAGMSSLMLGKVLKKFKDERLYEDLGEESPEYTSLEMFLQMPEINIKLRKAYYLIQIYTTFCETFKFKPEELSEISWTSLRVILPVVRPENAKDLVEDAKLLRRTDLEIKVAQLRKGIENPEMCRHREVEKIVFFKCVKCRENFKVAPKGSKIIEE